MDMPQTIPDEVAQSLNRAGIFREYHNRSLREGKHPIHAELLEWVGNARSDYGKGLTFVGGAEAEDAAILTARGLHVSGMGIRLRSLVSFVAMMMNEREDFREMLGQAQTLAITGMGPQHGEPRNEAFTLREIRTLEAVLVEWIQQCNRLILHSPVSGFGGWFSPTFVQRVARVNETMKVLP